MNILRFLSNLNPFKNNTQHDNTQQLYDFYYSQDQKNYLLLTGSNLYPLKFKGKPYTECIQTGKKLSGKWIDYQYVGTGTMNDCTFTD